MARPGYTNLAPSPERDRLFSEIAATQGMDPATHKHRVEMIDQGLRLLAQKAREGDEMKRTFSVISTSGWENDTWNYEGEFATRKEAFAHAKAIQQPNARYERYTTLVAGTPKICQEHSDMFVTCYIVRADGKEYHAQITEERAIGNPVPRLP